MAKNERLMIAATIIIAIVLLGQNAKTPTPSGNDNINTAGGVDLCKLVDGQVSFTGQDKYLAGTTRTAEYVRVLELNGDTNKRDLRYVSLSSGTIGVTPEAKYRLYYGENGTNYTYVETYTAPCQDATDNKVGYICQPDSAPTVTVFNENDQVQSGTTNAQAMGANDIIDVKVKVKAAADKCYGNPQASDKSKKNAICFSYNGTVFDSIKVKDGASSSIPYSVSSDAQKLAGYSQSCYELGLLKDTESQTQTVTLDASATEPTGIGHAINITLEDVDVDLNQDSLEEIWDFQDESNNNLGQPIYRVAGIQLT